MIPNPDQLTTISHMREGDLAEVPFAVLLHALAVHRRSVVLEIERTPLKKEIILEAGMPVDCRSNLLQDTLGSFMVSRGDITDEVYRETLGKSASQGLQFGEVLVLDGRITASELYKILQLNLAKKLLDAFTWRSGHFRLGDDLPKVESPLKVNPAQLVVTGISKFALDEEVNEAVGPLVGKRLFIHPEPPWSLEEIRLTPTQRKLVQVIFDGKRIDELAAETTISFDQIMRLLYSLAVIGIVVPQERMPADAGELPQVLVDEPESEELPPVELEEGEDLEERRNEVMDAFLRHRKQDAFDLLGARDDASLADVETCFLEFSRRFAPWRFEVPGLLNLVEKAEALFLAGGRAFGELTDPERRNALVMRRRALREEAQRKPARDRFAIKSDLLDAELQFKKGQALLRAEKYVEALQQFQFAHDCEPQNSVYRSELAYCRYRMAPKREAERSLEELRETLRIDPQCGLAVYYTGVIHGDQGRIEEAESRLRRAIKLMMPDRRPIEALKKLQAKVKARRRRRLL